MKRRTLIAGLASAAAYSALAAPIAASPRADKALSERTRALLLSSPIVDMTAANSPIHPAARRPLMYQQWVSQYKGAGVTWLSMTISSDFTKNTADMLHSLAANRRYLLTRPDEYIFIESTTDVKRAKIEGKLGVNFNFQGSNPLEGDINLVEPLRRLGVGHMLLAYNDMNLAAGGSHSKDNPGLSYFGRQLVKEMNRVGMVVDCTHTGERSSMDIMELSAQPVIFSHSSARALRDHERNIGDHQIKACAATGGVVGINGVGLYLSENPYDISAKQLFRHIDYVAELVGHEYIGLGLDYAPEINKPQIERNIIAQYTKKYGVKQYPSLSRMAITGPRVIAPLTELMVQHGYRDQEIRAILGGNVMRVFDEVWKAA